MNYAATAKRAAAMLKKAGTSMTLRVPTEGSFAPVSGTDSSETDPAYETVGVLTDVKVYLVDGSLVLAGDKIVLMSPEVAVRPEPNHVVAIGSTLWRVVSVSAVEPAGTPLLYKLQVRRG